MSVNVSAENMNACEIDSSGFSKNFYDLLFKQNDYKSAMGLVKERETCIDNNDEAAFVIDMNAELMRYSYMRTHDKEFSDNAESLYKKALDLNSKHDDVILWHLSMLMWEKGDYKQGIKYIDQALQKKPKDPIPYYSTALILSVEVGHWKQAKALVNVLLRNKKDYYLSIPLLSATVKTLCHYNKSEAAQQFVKNVEKSRSNMRTAEKEMFQETKKLANSC